jgi:hypothetical protein
VIDCADLTRLPLRIQRALVARQQLHVLLLEADATVLRLQRELRNVKARAARAAAVRRSTTKERHA